MTKSIGFEMLRQPAATALGVMLIAVLSPLIASAGQQSESCSALVSAGNSLYLTNTAGTVLTQFVSGDGPYNDAAISPDGSKVAYLTADPDRANVYTVNLANSHGQRGSFSVRPTSNSVANHDPTDGLAANNPIEVISWTSNDVLWVTKLGGKDVARFEYYRIPDNLSTPVHRAAEPVLAQYCVPKRADGPLACIEEGGLVSLGPSAPDGENIYIVPRYDGAAPIESHTVHVGQSVVLQNGPPFTVAIPSITKNQIMLQVIPSDTDLGEETEIDSGTYMGVTDSNGTVYGFKATIVNAKDGTVKIDVVKSNSPEKNVDLALAWQPHGDGLLFVRHTDTQTFLDLIHPGRGPIDAERETQDGPQWHLAAEASISLPGEVTSMRFLTPSLLLLRSGDFHNPTFSEVPIHIANGLDNGKPELTLGTVTPLPATISVTTNGTITEGAVSDWSCGYSHGDTDDDGG